MKMHFTNILLLVVSSLFITSTSFPASIMQISSKSECELIELKNESEDELVPTVDQLNLNDIKETSLFKIHHEQIIIAAKEIVKITESEVHINNVSEALNYFRSTQDPYIKNYDISKYQYTQIGAYVGDNPFSVIFRRNSTKIIAIQEDSRINCR